MWFRVDDTFPDHPKVLELPDCAVALWTRAGAWSARNLTDGFIPGRLIARYCEDPERAVDALVRNGLWVSTPDGLRFHDWADYNPTKDLVDVRRKIDRDRKKVARSGSPVVLPESGRNPNGRQSDSGQTTGHEVSEDHVRSDSDWNPLGVRAESSRPDPEMPPPEGGAAFRGEGKQDPTTARSKTDRFGHDDSQRPKSRPSASAPTSRSSSTRSDPRQRAAAREQAIAACGRCDERGYIGAAVCDHGLTDAASAEARAAAMAEIRSALTAGKTRPPENLP
jgi:hypothetical protein